MKTEGKWILIVLWMLIVAGCFTVVTATFCIGIHIGVRDMQKEAVKQGFAEYDSQTGKWQWKKNNGD